MREAILDAFVRFFQRKRILDLRKRKKERVAKARKRDKVRFREES
jgi:hypothetical protein